MPKVAPPATLSLLASNVQPLGVQCVASGFGTNIVIRRLAGLIQISVETMTADGERMVVQLPRLGVAVTAELAQALIDSAESPSI
jgi:hypothetical protein